MNEDPDVPRAGIGFTSATGPRPRNEDFVGAVLGSRPPAERRDVAAAIADGIGSAKGGREAAETAVRGFLDGFWDVPETMEVRRAGARILDALNGWINAQGRQDPNLVGMGCTFTALVLRGRLAHLLHVGDTRAYRLSADRLVRLTTDHVRDARGRSPVLTRALGIEPEVRLDYTSHPVALHDRFLLCTDGVHGALVDEAIADILCVRSAPEDTSRALVEAALAAGSTDNCTALVLDVVALPTARSEDVGAAIRRLPIVPVPQVGETIDGFVLNVLVSEGRYSRLFGAVDEVDGGTVVLKFPKPQVAAVATIHAAFVREAWVGTRITSPWVAHVIELPPGRQTCLYTVMPLYVGELLETRLARAPGVGLEEGRGIAIHLAHAAGAMHRAGIIHRDIKPDNVILEAGGSLKLLDLGVVRLPGLEDFPPDAIPGTAAYMAPEMFAGEAGNVATDVYALGVTMFRTFTGTYPYGNPDATAAPGQQRPKDLATLRPDLPAWLAAALARAIAPEPAERFADMAEFAHEFEAGPTYAPPPTRRPPTLYERAPVRFWQAIAALLALALAAALFWK
ncbi:MAG: bifunctional protein-serine/threonine kinase/phosphatase [Proteobacteria bacterium]|nr:bifunctional protein-serine/threonine kinase/phosphatase [Pseudomonadota bacterium]